MKIGYVTPISIRESHKRIGVQNSLESAFTILLSSKTLKTLILPQIIIRESY